MEPIKQVILQEMNEQRYNRKHIDAKIKDFITNDTTLVYSGQLPSDFNASTQKVRVEVLNSGGTVVQGGFASVNGALWSWDDTSTTLASGNYTIRSTIVGLTNTTAVASYGAGAVATHPMTIDTTTPTVAITRTDGLSTTVGSTGTSITFTVAESAGGSVPNVGLMAQAAQQHGLARRRMRRAGRYPRRGSRSRRRRSSPS